jgi:sulfur carrier protein
VRIWVNGELRDLPDALTIAELVEQAAPELRQGRGMAIAVDAEVVPRGEWDRRRLLEGQRVELLVAMQGGAT